MADAAPGLRPRPISPSVTVWRWHVTMLGSILHRVTGSGLYVGALVLMAWALALASGPGAYSVFTGLASSILGKIVLIGLTLSAFYHLCNGIRHLTWDAGFGFMPQTASSTAWLVIGLAVTLTVLFWAFLFMSGAL